MVNFKARELFERDNPSAKGNARAGDAGAGAGDGYWSRRRLVRSAGFAQHGYQRGFIGRNDQPLGVAAEAGGVFQVARVYWRNYLSNYSSRITGMISGRREVSFEM